MKAHLKVQKEMRYKPKLRTALITLVAQGGIAAKAKKPAVAFDLLEDLRALGLAHLTLGQKRMVWRATEDGRAWVRATGLRPVFLAQRSDEGYTRSVAHGLSREPEVIDSSAIPYAERDEEKAEDAEPGETLRESIAAMKRRRAGEAEAA